MIPGAVFFFFFPFFFFFYFCGGGVGCGVGDGGVVVGQNPRCLFGGGSHCTVVFLEGFLGVHRRIGVLTGSRVGTAVTQIPGESAPPGPETGGLSAGAHRAEELAAGFPEDGEPGASPVV